MIVLDTNVLSELLRKAPDVKVVAWLEAHARPSLFTTTITRGEILFGVRLLPEGRRRHDLWEAVVAIFNDEFVGRVLPYDNEAADAFAEIGAARRAEGLPISQFDAQIAAIARTRGAVLATRNVKDFQGTGIQAVNPWDA